MFNTKNNDLNNLIMLDFSIIKKKTKNKYNFDKKYYIWPENNNIQLEYIPSYSTCINGLELLFGHKNIINIKYNSLDKYLKIIKDKDKSAHNIFLNGLILKINTENFLKLFNYLVII
jgi:hypothetical protein